MIFDGVVDSLAQTTNTYTVKNNSESVPPKLEMNYDCCFWLGFIIYLYLGK